MTSSVDLDIWLREKLPFDFDLLPAEAYLVGGAVRDVLLGREREYLDLDFVLPANSIPLAKKIAHICQAGFVILDQTREIARVVFAQGTVDFAKQEGATLEEDLYRRDFTINAIAYQKKKKKIIDPLGGKRDLEQKLVRMVSVQNLKDDPLRLIRAYRQAGQLDLNIEIETRKQIIKLAPLLQQVAAERVKTEINYMLETPQGTAWLIEAISDGLLVDWLPTT
ncbi:MAG: CCA tRNA nucleotidyltransferase, partial [Cyanobacteria bacterium J083]